MYSACIFCNKPLGTNEMFETFPIGKRLAFDSARGRLWVVCPQCERWNLSPLEERWETIEHAERAYRDARKRVATDNIGLAKLGDGTTIVRVGKPLRPEFAAWRYGDQFGRRRRRRILKTGAGVLAAGGLVAGWASVGFVGVMGYALGPMLGNLIIGSPASIVTKLSIADHGVVELRNMDLVQAHLGRGDDGQLALDLPFVNGRARFVGHEAERVMMILAPCLNRYGGSQRAIDAAVREIEIDRSTEAYLERVSGLAQYWTRPENFSKWNPQVGRPKNGLFALPPAHRLALEMALHEESERRAMEGELAELERAWQDADAVAQIADRLLVPRSIESALAKFRKSE